MWLPPSASRGHAESAGPDTSRKLAKNETIGTVRSHLLSKRSPCAWEDIHLALDSFFLPFFLRFSFTSSRKDRSFFARHDRANPRSGLSIARSASRTVCIYPLSLRMCTLISLITISPVNPALSSKIRRRKDSPLRKVKLASRLVDLTGREISSVLPL